MKQFGMAVIGLGVVGRRMLEQVARHGGFRVVAALDTSAATRASIAADFPDVPLCASLDEAIARPDVDIVYVAVPPLAHAACVRAAIAAGKAILCEKPLGVDLAESRALVDEVQASGLPNAVNFVFASSAAVDALADSVRADAFGLRSIEVQVRFHQWPRAWQAGATWLERSDQGGYTREVLSHFVYLLHRLFGAPRLLGAFAHHPPAPGAAEIASAAVLDCGGIPASIAGSVGGQAPDVVEARFVGASRELRLVDWFRLLEPTPAAPQGVPVPGLPDDPRKAVFQAQLDQLRCLLVQAPHSLPDFRAAFTVQQVIESILRTASR